MSKDEAQQLARRRLRVTELHPHLMCVLCGGYYVDATTIIECLHSFCKSCLVRYLESNKYCPICEVQVHKTKPLQNIRPDETLQTMVYKLVPGLFQREMRLRQEFYAKHPEAPPSSPEDRGIVDPIECQFYSPDEPVSLALEFQNDSANSNSNGVHRRYLRCPAAVTVAHLQKLVRNKYGLEPCHSVDVLFEDKVLKPDLSIMDVAYSHQRKRKEQFHFTYRILELQCKKMKLEAPALSAEIVEKMDVDPPVSTSLPTTPAQETKTVVYQSQPENKSKLDSIISRLGIAKQAEKVVKKDKHSDEWKEVQLQISENGVMSVTDISPIDKLIDAMEKNMEPLENPSASKDKSMVQKTLASPEKKVSTSEVKSEVSSLTPSDKKTSSLSVTLVKKEEGKHSVSLKSDPNKTMSQPAKSESKEKESVPNKPPSGTSKKDVAKETLKTESRESKQESRESKLESRESKPAIPTSLPVQKIPVTGVQHNIPLQKVSASTSPAASSSNNGQSSPSISAPNVHVVNSVASSSGSKEACSSSSGSKEACPSSSGSKEAYPLTPSSVSMNTGASSLPVHVTASSAASSKSTATALTTTTAVRASPVPVAKPVSTSHSAKKSGSPFGYKTLKCGPKNWNPSISRNSFLSSKLEQQQHQQPNQQGSSSGSASSTASEKPATPPRFFKMRNTPRYLGNPASGVKAMYQVPESKPETPPPAKSPSVMKLDPRTLTPIVSNASSPTSKSPVQPKGRPPFPSTTLSAQVSSHMPSSRSAATTTTTTSASTKLADLTTLRNSQTQPIVNPFLANSFLHKGMPNFLYGGVPGLLPSGPQFASMLRPGLGYPPVSAGGFHPTLPQAAGMLFNPHQLHRQVSSSSPVSPSSYSPSLASSPSSMPPSPSPLSPVLPSKSNQRTLSSSEKPMNNTPNSHISSNRNNRCNLSNSATPAADSSKLNGGEVHRDSVANRGKTQTTSANHDHLISEPKSKEISVAVPKDVKKTPPSTTDNNNTLLISKSKSPLEKLDGGKSPLDVSKLVSKESGKCSDAELISRSKTPTSTSYQAQQS